jgi:hypothetical protein
LAQLAIPQVSQNELAHDVVDGMAVRRGHESVKLAPNSPGKNSAYARVTDYWFSQELQAFVLVKRSGPGKSQHTVKLSDISRREPDLSFFTEAGAVGRRLFPEAHALNRGKGTLCEVLFSVNRDATFS